MVLIDGFPQPGPHHVRVNLGGRDIRMAQHGLDTAQVGSAFEKMGGETMPDHVGGQTMKDAGFLPMRP
jgi:hypothetical protein